MTKKHMLLMLACCLIPIGAILAIGVLNIPTTGLVSVLIVLMCPVMMLLMMFGMHGGHEEHHAHQTSIPAQKEQIETHVEQHPG